MLLIVQPLTQPAHSVRASQLQGPCGHNFVYILHAAFIKIHKSRELPILTGGRWNGLLRTEPGKHHLFPCSCRILITQGLLKQYSLLVHNHKPNSLAHTLFAFITPDLTPPNLWNIIQASTAQTVAQRIHKANEKGKKYSIFGISDNVAIWDLAGLTNIATSPGIN